MGSSAQARDAPSDSASLIIPDCMGPVPIRQSVDICANVLLYRLTMRHDETLRIAGEDELPETELPGRRARISPWIASETFGSPSLSAVYIGSLEGKQSRRSQLPQVACR